MKILGLENFSLHGRNSTQKKPTFDGGDNSERSISLDLKQMNDTFKHCTASINRTDTKSVSWKVSD